MAQKTWKKCSVSVGSDRSRHDRTEPIHTDSRDRVLTKFSTDSPNRPIRLFFATEPIPWRDRSPALNNIQRKSIGCACPQILQPFTCWNNILTKLIGIGCPRIHQLFTCWNNILTKLIGIGCPRIHQLFTCWNNILTKSIVIGCPRIHQLFTCWNKILTK